MLMMPAIGMQTPGLRTLSFNHRVCVPRFIYVCADL